MNGKVEAFTVENLQWVNDVALYRSLMGRVPWVERFGQGRVKSLSFDEKNEAGAWLIEWPTGYNPLQEHAHGGNEHVYILEGELIFEGKVYAVDSYMYFPKGVRHSYAPGKHGCRFLSIVDGPFFDEEFIQELMATGPASRHRDQDHRPAT